MFESKIVKHANILEQDLNEIILIKSVAWPYPYEKQIKWMDNHLKDSDLHLLLFNKNKAVAYLNLITIKLLIDNAVTDGLGVGNVCTIEKGMGLGNELMKQTNQYIKNENKIGLLFCKPNLVSFYIKNGWHVIIKNQLNVVFDNKNVETMIFNYKLPFKKLTFGGMAF